MEALEESAIVNAGEALTMDQGRGLVDIIAALVGGAALLVTAALTIGRGNRIKPPMRVVAPRRRLCPSPFLEMV
jgi:hypothetical protein